jgi:hypothetical protein
MVNRILQLALLLTVAGALPAQSPAPGPARVEVQKVGPQLGDAVPDFSALDQHGRRRTLAELLGPKGAMLVFFRSADW